MLRLTAAAHNIVKSLKELNNRAAQNAQQVSKRFHKKIEGTIVENWVKFWKNVFRDYKEVIVDLKGDIIQRPLKAVAIVSVLGSIAYSAKHNPNEIHFRDACVSCMNQLLLVHPDSQNIETVHHLKNIEKCYNNLAIRRLNVGIASIIWTDYYSSSCHNYYSTCPYLQLQYTQFWERILDIGLLDRWWMLRNKMQNYDVNF